MPEATLIAFTMNIEAPPAPKTPPRTPNRKPSSKAAQDFYGWTPYMVNGKIVVKEPEPVVAATAVGDEIMEVDELLESEPPLRILGTPSRKRPPHSGRTTKSDETSSKDTKPVNGERVYGTSSDTL